MKRDTSPAISFAVSAKEPPVLARGGLTPAQPEKIPGIGKVKKLGCFYGPGEENLKMGNDIFDRDKLRAEAVGLLGFDAANLSPLQALQCDLAAALMLELETIQAQQLSGREIDINRYTDLSKILKSLLPAQTQTPPAPDFTEARAGLAALVYQRADAIEHREKYQSMILQEKIAALEAEYNRLRMAQAALPSPKRADESVASQPAAAPDYRNNPKYGDAHKGWVETGGVPGGDCAIGAFSSDWRKDR